MPTIPSNAKAPAATPTTMGKAKKAEAAAIPQEPTNDREIIYPKLQVKICCAGDDGDAPPITCEQMKKALGWETEEEYTNRMLEADSDLDPETAKFGDDFLLKDEAGNKVRCWNNSINRPFTESHAKELAQDILNRRWAGPTTMPGETINCETIVIGRTGQIESGQHRGVGFVLACQRWERNPVWQEKWPEEPVLESLVATGASEAPQVIMTLDNVRPRTLSDIYYTSELFADLPSVDKKECSRMGAKATDMLWKYSGSGGEGDRSSRYQTHSESRNFLDRHSRLLKCVKHIYEENKNRTISKLKLSPGMCAALMYFMGSSTTDGNDYRAMEVRSEKKLSWTNFARATEFWVAIAKNSPEVKAVTFALNALKEVGTQVEKMCVLAKAWEAFVGGHTVTPSDVQLNYHTSEDGTVKLLDIPDFGGIWLAEEPEDTSDPEPPTPEEIEAEKTKKRKKLAAKAKEAVETTKVGQKEWPKLGNGHSLSDQLDALHEQHPDKILLFKRAGNYGAWGDDARKVDAILKTGQKSQSGMMLAEIPTKKLESYVQRLVAAGHKVAVCEQVNGDTTVEDVAEPEAAETETEAKPATKAGKRKGDQQAIREKSRG